MPHVSIALRLSPSFPGLPLLPVPPTHPLSQLVETLPPSLLPARPTSGSPARSTVSGAGGSGGLPDGDRTPRLRRQPAGPRRFVPLFSSLPASGELSSNGPHLSPPPPQHPHHCLRHVCPRDSKCKVPVKRQRAGTPRASARRWLQSDEPGRPRVERVRGCPVWSRRSGRPEQGVLSAQAGWPSALRLPPGAGRLAGRQTGRQAHERAGSSCDQRVTGRNRSRAGGCRRVWGPGVLSKEERTLKLTSKAERKLKSRWTSPAEEPASGKAPEARRRLPRGPQEAPQHEKGRGSRRPLESEEQGDRRRG